MRKITYKKACGDDNYMDRAGGFHLIYIYYDEQNL